LETKIFWVEALAVPLDPWLESAILMRNGVST
jgi:hypothetical protein